MKFRAARHTNNLKAITDFYTKVIGLKALGSFENHDDYNGVFLGVPGEQWHLEFTESHHKTLRRPNEDDLLVFYLKDQETINTILENAKKVGIEQVQSQNPYWNNNGVELRDPDNFGVILTLE